MRIKTRKRVLIATACLVSFGLVAAAAVSCGRAHLRSDDPEKVKKFVRWQVDDVLDDLDATDAQRRAVFAATDKILADAFQMKKNHHGNKELVHKELQKDKPDAELLHAMIDKRAQEMTAFAHRSLDSALEAYNVLTPEQKADLLDEMEDRFHRH